jgi:hypothetical protein
MDNTMDKRKGKRGNNNPQNNTQKIKNCATQNMEKSKRVVSILFI